jgi:hypothetical protein
MQGVADCIDRAIHEACRHVKDIPDDIIVGFSPMTCIHDHMVSQYMREDEAAPLTMEELDMMIEKIEKSSLQRAKEKAKTEYGVIHDDIRLISSTLTSIMIDGKNVTHAIGLPGKYVRIHVLNIFALASEYNVLRSIIASLKKRPISLVPIPLLFSKIIEKTKMSEEETIFIDIGYSNVTIVFQKDQEITFFDTFEIGSKMLIDILQSALPDMSYTSLENLLMRQNPESSESLIRESSTHEYLTYVIDTLLSVLMRSGDSMKMKNVCISGGIFASAWIEKIFFSILSESIGYTVRHMRLGDGLLSTPMPAEYILNAGLAELGRELLHTKKDPIIRILRYTLYHYE